MTKRDQVQPDPMAFLYGGLTHGEPALLKHFDKIPGGDGQPVEVYVTALPARFYTIKALASENSVGEAVKAFTLGTGSDMEQLALRIAKAISEGMLALKED